MERRREDIVYRLTRLKSEILLTQPLLMQLLNNSTEIANSILNEADLFKFRKEYPSKVSELDARLHHILEFNCLVESLIESALERETDNQKPNFLNHEPNEAVSSLSHAEEDYPKLPSTESVLNESVGVGSQLCKDQITFDSSTSEGWQTRNILPSPPSDVTLPAIDQLTEESRQLLSTNEASTTAINLPEFQFETCSIPNDCIALSIGTVSSIINKQVTTDQNDPSQSKKGDFIGKSLQLSQIEDSHTIFEELRPDISSIHSGHVALFPSTINKTFSQNQPYQVPYTDDASYETEQEPGNYICTTQGDHFADSPNILNYGVQTDHKNHLESENEQLIRESDQLTNIKDSTFVLQEPESDICSIQGENLIESLVTSKQQCIKDAHSSGNKLPATNTEDFPIILQERSDNSSIPGRHLIENELPAEESADVSVTKDLSIILQESGTYDLNIQGENALASFVTSRQQYNNDVLSSGKEMPTSIIEDLPSLMQEPGFDNSSNQSENVIENKPSAEKSELPTTKNLSIILQDSGSDACSILSGHMVVSSPTGKQQCTIQSTEKPAQLSNFENSLIVNACPVENVFEPPRPLLRPFTPQIQNFALKQTHYGSPISSFGHGLDNRQHHLSQKQCRPNRTANNSANQFYSARPGTNRISKPEQNQTWFASPNKIPSRANSPNKIPNRATSPCQIPKRVDSPGNIRNGVTGQENVNVPTSNKLAGKFTDILISLIAGGSDWHGLVAHAVSPSEFYFHVSCSDNDKIDVFHGELNRYYKAATQVPITRKQDARAKVGIFCVCCVHFAEASERSWYRCQVLDWMMDTEDVVSIQLVDYGNKLTTKQTDLQPLAERFRERPVFATRCHLCYLQPPRPCKEWPQSTSIIFQKHLQLETLEKAYMISPTGKEATPPFCNPSDPMLNHAKSVPVIMVPEGSTETINDYLIGIEFAEFDVQMETCQLESMRKSHLQDLRDEGMRRVESWCTEEKRVVKPKRPKRPTREPSPEFRMGLFDPAEEPVLELMQEPVQEPSQELVDAEEEEWDPMREDFENAEVNDEDPCVAVTGYAPQDESRVCRFFAEDGNCPWGNKCRREHVLGNIHGITTDQEEVFNAAFNELPTHVYGDSLRIHMTSVPAADFFYAIEYLPAGASSETLDSLCDAINEPGNAAAYRRLRVPPALSQTVLALYSPDGRYYRGRVVELADKENGPLVFFVDYGNWQRVREADMREIEPRFMHLPFQAFQCTLANVELFTEKLVEAARYLIAKYENVLLRAVVAESESDVSMMQVLLYDDDGKDIGKAMIEKGFGFSVALANARQGRLMPGRFLPG